MADQLCTAAQVKARLWPAGLTTDTVDDTLVGELIDEVSDWIQLYTGRKFVPEVAATYTFDTQAGYVLRIPRGIRSVTSLSLATLSHQPDSGGTYVAVAAAGILLRPRSGGGPEGWPPTEIHLSRGTASPITFGTIENGAVVVGNFGFAVTPPAITSVAIDGTASAYQMRANPAADVFGADSSQGAPWWQFSLTSKRTLDMYRYIGIG